LPQSQVPSLGGYLCLCLVRLSNLESMANLLIFNLLLVFIY
jgi:hypothetical protein